MSGSTFWRGVTALLPELEALLRGAGESGCTERLDRLVQELDLGLSWEVGPGKRETYMLALGCGMDAGKLEAARELIAQAPTVEGWELLAGRPAREWDRRVEVRGRLVDLSGWRYWLAQYADGKLGVSFVPSSREGLSESDLQSVAGLLLVSELGESVAAAMIAEYEVVDSRAQRDLPSLSPVADLRDHLDSLVS